MPIYPEVPCDLRCAVEEFFPPEEWDNAYSIAWLESGFDGFAIADTRDPEHPCGSIIRHVDGVGVAAEYSIGYFQINACNFPGWPAERLFNVRHNVGTAHLLWAARGWSPWYFSAEQLGLS